MNTIRFCKRIQEPENKKDIIFSRLLSIIEYAKLTDNTELRSTCLDEINGINLLKTNELNDLVCKFSDKPTIHINGKFYEELPRDVYNDIFNARHYDFLKLFSLQDTLYLVEKYKIKKVNKDKLQEFWETYPDGMIEFY